MRVLRASANPPVAQGAAIVATLGALCGLAGFPPQAAAGLGDDLTAGWYTVEAIVFRRAGVIEADSGEHLYRTGERSVPAGIRSIDAGAATNAHDLSPLALATLEFPTLSFDCPAPARPYRPAGVPAWYQPALPDTGAGSDRRDSQSPSATPTGGQPPRATAGVAHPVADGFVRNACVPAGPDLESPAGDLSNTGAPHAPPPGSGTGEPCPPAPFDIPMAPGKSTALCRPQTGQPPPPIEPVLEPHPLLDRLSAAHRFRARLRERSYRAGTNGAILRREANRIRRAEDLRLLWHGRWTQPVPPRSAPQPLLIQAGRRTRGVAELEGTFSVTLGRYLHFHARLWQAGPPVPRPIQAADPSPAMHGPPSAAESPPTPGKVLHMALEESRVMRSGTLHYLDHPVLGVLVRADPVQAPRWPVDASVAPEPAEGGD